VKRAGPSSILHGQSTGGCKNRGPCPTTGVDVDVRQGPRTACVHDGCTEAQVCLQLQVVGQETNFMKILKPRALSLYFYLT
jgi:hypothetical protein